MKDTGVLMVQHGDFPFDFIEKQPEMYRRIEGVMQQLSEASRKLEHSPEQDPHAADVQQLAALVRAAGYDVETGYLDFALPTIADAVKTLAARGHRKIVVANTPGLMMRSSHSLIDVPAALKAIRADNPGIELLYAKPGGPLPLIARAIGKKIYNALDEPYASIAPAPAASRPGTAVVLVAHGDVPHDFVRANKGVMKDAEENTAMWSHAVQDWSRNAENDPCFADTLVLVVSLREMFFPRPIGIGYLEFARPSVGEAFDRLVAEGVRRVIVVGGTGFFDRSSHTLIDIPEAIARLQKKRPDIEITYAYPDIGLVKDELTRAMTYNIEKALDGEAQPF